MAKILITSVGYDQSNYTVLVVLMYKQVVDGKPEDIPLGEASIRFPSNTEMADIKTKIVDTAQGIMDAHKAATDKRKDIEELDFPDIH